MKLTHQLKQIRESKYYAFLVVAFRIILGIIFIAAAIPKLQDNLAFAEIVANYKILPISMVTRFAHVLPVVEIIAGIFLILGLYTRYAVSVILFLLVIFIVAISVNLWRGESAICGCFSVSEGGGELGWQTIVRDVIMMLLGAHILFATKNPYSLDAWLASRKHKVS